jgi:hypothetical protein
VNSEEEFRAVPELEQILENQLKAAWKRFENASPLTKSSARETYYAALHRFADYLTARCRINP